jgi:hypothetical protein
LRCQNEATAGFADNGELPVVGEGGICGGHYLLSLIGEHENQILVLHLLNVLKAHLEVHVCPELDERVDVNALGLEGGGNRDTEQLALVEVVKAESRYLLASVCN